MDLGTLGDLFTKAHRKGLGIDLLIWLVDFPEHARFAKEHPNIMRELLAGRATVDAGVVQKATGLLTTYYDQSLGLRKLIELAVGEQNLGNISPNITPKRFKLKGLGLREVKCWVEPYLDGETREQAAQRLTGAGHKLRNTGDLAGFLHDHPDEVEKWGWVEAISEDSRWKDSDGRVFVPCAGVTGACRHFDIGYFRLPRDSSHGVLVGE